ncbi:hypothetical protein PRIPAC_80422 [Pristionchus pacificus]|nr:hypothetical protein PRIPAC_80422 [Pristionchus pacificus]
MAVRHQPGAHGHQFQTPHWVRNQQPGAETGSDWMPKPPSISDVPEGLEYLGLVDQILIKQKREMMEIVFGWERNNRYFIMNGVGQQIYYAYETSDACSRQCCKQQRAFIIHIVDNFNREVMRISREFNCCAGCFPCCAEPGTNCAHMMWRLHLEIRLDMPVNEYHVRVSIPTKCMIKISKP